MGKLNSFILIMYDADASLMVFDAVRKSVDNISIINTDRTSGTQEDLSERIGRAYSKLSPYSEKHIIFSSYLEGAFALDIKIPKMPFSEVKNALAFEIQRQVPLHLETLIWTYRVICSEGNHLIVRVFLVRDEVWKKTLAVIFDSGIKIDFYMHPLLYENADASIRAEDATQFFQELMRNFSSENLSLPAAEKILNSITGAFHFDGSLLEKNAGCELGKILSCIAFRSKNPFKELPLFVLPAGLKPVRFKFLKISFLVLLILNVLLAGILCLRYSIDANKRLAELNAEKNRVRSELEKIKMEENKFKSLDDFMKKISDEDHGDHDVVLALLSLAKNLPPNMWITSFNTRGREIDLSISSSDDGNAQSELSKLNQQPEFSNMSVRNTRRDRDGTLTMYIKLMHNKNKDNYVGQEKK